MITVDWMVKGKVDFTRISVAIQSTEWHSQFSDLSVDSHFWIVRYAQHGSISGPRSREESTLTIRSIGTMIYGIIWNIKLTFESVLGTRWFGTMIYGFIWNIKLIFESVLGTFFLHFLDVLLPWLNCYQIMLSTYTPMCGIY